MQIDIKISVQHSMGETDTVSVERFTNTIGGSAQADALCQAANTALGRAVPDSGYVLAVVKKGDE